MTTLKSQFPGSTNQPKKVLTLVWCVDTVIHYVL